MAAALAASGPVALALSRCPAAAEDRALTAAAAAFADAALADETRLSQAALRFEIEKRTWDAGAPVAAYAKVEPVAAWEPALGSLLPAACDATALGAALRSRGTVALVAVVLARRGARLASLPREVEDGAPLTIEGELAAGYHDPGLHLTGPDGSVRRAPLHVVGQRFSATLRLERGAWSLEVLAQGPHGPEVVALRRAWVGVSAPAAPEARAEGDADPKAGEREAEVRLNALRDTHALPALKRDARLDAVARSHSEAMAAAKLLAHDLPDGSGSIGVRLGAAAYGFAWAGEALGEAASALGAQDAIDASPAHRAVLLDPRGTHLGLSAVLTGGRTWVTEIVAQPAGGDGGDPSGAVRDALRRARELAGATPLLGDSHLDALATLAARTMAFNDDVQAMTVNGKPLRDAALDGGADVAAAEAIVGSAPADVERASGGQDTRWRRVGVGAVWASSKRYGAGRLWIALVYASP